MSETSNRFRCPFESVPDSPDERPDVLVVAFDTTLVYSRLCRATWWASQGVPYIATNPDWVCPTDQEVILVDCGSICKAIEGACKRKPDVVIGKPNPNMLYCIRDKYGYKSDELAMVGDRIYTDVATAQNAGSQQSHFVVQPQVLLQLQLLAQRLLQEPLQIYR